MRRTSAKTSFLAAMCLLASGLAATAGISTAHAAGPFTADAAPSFSPATPFAGEKFSIEGRLTDTVVAPRDFVVQIKSGVNWVTAATGQTAADGTYSANATATAASLTYRVTAPETVPAPPADPADPPNPFDVAVTTGPATVTTVADHAMVSILRDCAAPTSTGSTCSATATATGSVAVDGATINPVTGDTVPTHDARAVREGRLFALQRGSGSSWTQIGAKVAEDANGTIHFDSFSLAGLAQYKTAGYRIVGDVFNGAKAVTSPTINFMPGPTALGPNVLRVITDKNIAVTKKKTNYVGAASFSTGNKVTASQPIQTLSLHGTSTAGFAKKPYKLKFFKKQKLFGMPNDKTWILLAMFVDRSAVRDKISLDIAGQALLNENLKWSPRNQYTEMFVNGEYKGAYLAVESVKLDTNRIPAPKATGISATIQGVLGSTGHFTIPSGEHGYTTSHNIPIFFKDPDSPANPWDDPAEGYSTAKLNGLKSHVSALENQLYNKPSGWTGPNGYEKYLDVPSSIDYYLVKEFAKDNDGDFFRSFYFWLSNYADTSSKMYMGPNWDSDRSAGVVSLADARHKYTASPSGWFLRGTGIPLPPSRPNYKSHWYVQLFKDSGYNTQVKAEWNRVKCQSFYLAGLPNSDPRSSTHNDVDLMGVAASNEWSRWGSSSRVYSAKGGGFAGEVNWVTTWYKNRYNWMNGQLDPNHTVNCS